VTLQRSERGGVLNGKNEPVSAHREVVAGGISSGSDLRGSRTMFTSNLKNGNSGIKGDLIGRQVLE